LIGESPVLVIWDEPISGVPPHEELSICWVGPASGEDDGQET
jgi:hypothetical protein